MEYKIHIQVMNKVAAAHHPSYVIYVILVVFLVSVQFFKFGSFLVHLVLRVEWQVLYVLQFITRPLDCYENVFDIVSGFFTISFIMTPL